MKDNKKVSTFMVLTIGFLALATIGSLSYAYFTTVIEEGPIYSLSGKTVSNGYRITFTESQTGIVLENTYPMPDQMGLELSPYTFTVKSDETINTMNVKVIVEVLTESTLADDLVSVSIDGNIKPLTSDLSVNTSETAYKSAYQIHTFTLNPGETKSYDVRMWINSNGTLENAQNKSWSSRILVVPEP